MILVARKSVVRCAALLDALKGAGQTLVAVTSTNTAISHLWVAHFDWLFCEISLDLPHDGLDLAEYARQISPHTKIILIADRNTEGLGGLESGAFAIVSATPYASDIHHILRLIEESEKAS